MTRVLTERTAKYASVVTIVDIARICNVSTASVSRVMTGLPGVKAEKREQILSTAENIGYRPNRAARRLVTNKSFMFGFIASDLRNTAYLEYFHTLEREVRREGYEFLIADSEQSVEQENANIEKMLDNRVDGLMLAAGHIQNRDTRKHEKPVRRCALHSPWPDRSKMRGEAQSRE